MSVLSADLIELVLTIEPKKTISTIREIRDKLSIQHCQQQTRSMQTRSMTKSIPNNIKRLKLELDYSPIFWNCYKKSTWLKYFLDTSNASNSNNYPDLIEYVDNVMNELMGFYKALSIYALGDRSSASASARNNSKIENFENTVIKNFNDSKYRQMLDCIIANYSNLDTIKDISAFVLFWTLLYQCGYLASIFQTNPIRIHDIFISSISSKRKNKDNTQELTYYQLEYGLFPLAHIYCGMGYNYVIAWDFSVASLIGFLEGGSNATDVEGNYINMMKYVNISVGKRKQRANMAKLDDYLAILNSVINKNCDVTQLFSLSIN